MPYLALIKISWNFDDVCLNSPVNARELWEKLEVKSDFSHWIKARIKKYDFMQGIDFIDAKNYVKDFNNLDTLKSIDYFISLDMAKELSIEPHLIDGGKFSHAFLRGAAGKLNIQVMKIAANLHLLDGGLFENHIDDKHVNAAIGIANELFEANINLCHDKGIMGTKAEYTAILSLFDNDQRPRTERNIIKIKTCTQPFKNFTGNKSVLIRKTLAEMTEQGLLNSFSDSTGKLFYELAQ